MMRKIAVPILAFLLQCGFSLSSASAQVFDEVYYTKESSFALHGVLAFKSDYMFRGQNLYNGASFQPSIRPKLNTGIGSFYADVAGKVAADQGDTKSPEGGSFDAADANGDTVRTGAVIPAFDEVDVDAGYEADLDLLSVVLGHRWYSYSVHDDSPLFGRRTARLENTNEFHTLLDFNIPLHPHALLAYDYDQNKGLYYETGLRHSIPMTYGNKDNAVIPFVKLGLTAGLDDDQRPLYDKSGLAFVDAGVRGIFYIYPKVSLQPEIHYSEGVDDFTDSEFLFGMSLVGDMDF